MGSLVRAGLLEVWHLFAFTLVTGIVWSFSEPVRQALIPNVVPREDLLNAVALNSAAFNFMKIVGPSLGGALIAWFGLAGNFYVQSAAYLMVLWMIYEMHVPPAERDAAPGSVLTNLREGFRYVWSNPVVLAIMVVSLVPRIFTMPYQTLMPIFQKDVLQVGPEGLGMLLAAPGAGALLAMLSVAHFANRAGRTGILLLIALVLQGVTLCLFSQMRSLPWALVTLVAVGGSQIVYMSTTHAVLQMTVPDSLRGRVMSIYMLDRGMMPAGALFAGISAHFVGAPNTVAAMGLIVIILAGIVAWRVPHLRKLET
jgi:predicted MFS family arabinose efflux permease